MKQTTYQINGFNIVLPIGLPQVLNTPVRDSYQDFLQEDTSLVRRHLTALTTLIPKHWREGTVRVLHAFGGVGATAQVIDKIESGVHHTFWERDPVLVEYLRQQFPAADVREVKDSYELMASGDIDLAQYGAIMFDPSVGTIKTPKIKACWKLMGESGADLIWLSDTACAKIHLNAPHYEKDFGTPVGPTAEGYLAAYNYWLRRNHELTIVDAMREAAETYAVVLPTCFADGQRFPNPIPYM